MIKKRVKKEDKLPFGLEPYQLILSEKILKNGIFCLIKGNKFCPLCHADIPLSKRK